MWAGRLTPEKAPHLAIAAAQRLAMPLVLAGPISDPDYVDAAVRPHLRGDITYAGHLHQSELAELVGNSAAALVTPMWDEPFGQVAAEALMCGTPVAALQRGGLPHVLGALGAGHLAAPIPEDASGRALQERIESLAAATARAMGADRRAVRADAKQRLGLGAMVSGYEQIYATLIEAPRLSVSSLDGASLVPDGSVRRSAAANPVAPTDLSSSALRLAPPRIG